MVEPDVVPFGAPLKPKFVPACLHLHTKTQYYRQEDQEAPPGMIAESGTSQYWCGKTHDHIGPDQDGCDPASCQRARACYEAPGSPA